MCVRSSAVAHHARPEDDALPRRRRISNATGSTTWCDSTPTVRRAGDLMHATARGPYATRPRTHAETATILQTGRDRTMKLTSSNFCVLLQLGSPAFRSNWRQTPRWFDEVSSSTHPEEDGADPAASLRPTATEMSCTTPSLVTMAPECPFDWTLMGDLPADPF